MARSMENSRPASGARIASTSIQVPPGLPRVISRTPRRHYHHSFNYSYPRHSFNYSYPSAFSVSFPFRLSPDGTAIKFSNFQITKKRSPPGQTTLFQHTFVHLCSKDPLVTTHFLPPTITTRRSLPNIRFLFQGLAHPWQQHALYPRRSLLDVLYPRHSLSNVL